MAPNSATATGIPRRRRRRTQDHDSALEAELRPYRRRNFWLTVFCVAIFLSIAIPPPNNTHTNHPASTLDLDFDHLLSYNTTWSTPPIPMVLRQPLDVMAYALPEMVPEWIMHLPIKTWLSAYENLDTAKSLYVGLNNERRNVKKMQLMWKAWIEDLGTRTTEASWAAMAEHADVEEWLECDDASPQPFATYLRCIWKHRVRRGQQPPPTLRAIPDYCHSPTNLTIPFTDTLTQLATHARNNQHQTLAAVHDIATSESTRLLSLIQPALDGYSRQHIRWRLPWSASPFKNNLSSLLPPSAPGTPLLLPNGAPRTTPTHLYGVTVPSHHAQHNLEAWMTVYAHALATEMLARAMLAVSTQLHTVCELETQRAWSASRVNLLSDHHQHRGEQTKKKKKKTRDDFSLRFYLRSLKDYLETLPIPFSTPQRLAKMDQDDRIEDEERGWHIPFFFFDNASNKGARSPLLKFLNAAMRNDSCEFMFDRPAPLPRTSSSSSSSSSDAVAFPESPPRQVWDQYRGREGQMVDKVLRRQAQNAVWEFWWGEGVVGDFWETALDEEAGGPWEEAYLPLGVKPPLTQLAGCRIRLGESRTEEYAKRKAREEEDKV